MEYICPFCGQSMDFDVGVIYPHNEEHIVEEIKKTHPNWSESDGMCKKCYDFYKNQMNK